MKKGLRDAGFVVNVAGDGLEGLHLALESEFSLCHGDGLLAFRTRSRGNPHSSGPRWQRLNPAGSRSLCRDQGTEIRNRKIHI